MTVHRTRIPTLGTIATNLITEPSHQRCYSRNTIQPTGGFTLSVPMGSTHVRAPQRTMLRALRQRMLQPPDI